MSASLHVCPNCNDRGWERVGLVDHEAVLVECEHCERGRSLARARFDTDPVPQDWVNLAWFCAFMVGMVALGWVAAFVPAVQRAWFWLTAVFS
jgi:hypothetical protein